MKIPMRNIPLIVVLVLTVLVSLFLIYLVVQKHGQVSQINTKIEEYKKILEDANKRKPPAPVTENYKNITIDTEKVAMEKFLLQHRFGHFYRKPLLHLANAIGIEGKELDKKFSEYYNALPEDRKLEIAGSKELIADFLSGKDRAKLDFEKARYRDYLNESSLLKAFSEYYSSLPNEQRGNIIGGSNDKVLLSKFLEKYDPAKVKKGLEEFLSEISAMTVEPVTANNVHEFILAALGLPRTAFVTYYKGNLRNLQNLFYTKNIVPGAETMADVEKFTFKENFQPSQKQIPLVIRQMVIREDLFKRLRAAGPVQLIEISETTPPLIGQKQDPYLIYDYSVTVQAPMDTLRKLINIFQEAYRDNVVYVIRDFSLARVARENVADLISEESKDPVVALIRQFQTPDFEVKDTDGNLLAGSYGRPMIGRNNNIEMKLSLRLILHVANQLERVDLQKN